MSIPLMIFLKNYTAPSIQKSSFMIKFSFDDLFIPNKDLRITE